MSKARITLTFTVDLKPEYYDENYPTPESQLEFELESLRNGELLVEEFLQNTDDATFTGELVE